jgi:hypothetical protein
MFEKNKTKANDYEIETGLDLSDFFRTTKGKFKTRQAITIVEELTKQRDARKAAANCNNNDVKDVSSPLPDATGSQVTEN